jgi:diguanylate cyclase (GGDEF)-like protein
MSAQSKTHCPRIQPPSDETIRTDPPPGKPGPGNQACLVQIYPMGTGMGVRYQLDRAPLVIGRSDGCDVVANDASVSRRHAQVECGPDDRYRVVDLGSTNGTLLNKNRVRSHDLQDGDYLQVGKCIFRFLESGNLEQAYHEEIYRLTIIDALTNVFNKRYLLDTLERELARTERHRRPLSVALFDVDHFKQVNDQLGHLAGDCILRDLAGRVAPIFRREEVLARYGGEEFALVLPECPAEGAARAAERLRKAVADVPFLAEEQEVRVTVSVGVACTDGERPLTPEEFLAQADEKLYLAKEQGRDRVVA